MCGRNGCFRRPRIFEAIWVIPQVLERMNDCCGCCPYVNGMTWTTTYSSGFTAEEAEKYESYLAKLFTPTGKNFNDYFDEGEDG